MELYDRHASLPPPHAEREVFGERRSGELRALGRRPRLTLGERTFGAFKEFRVVDMGRREMESEFTVGSATGRQKFRVKLEVEYSIRDAARIAEGGIDLDRTLIAPLRKQAILKGRLVRIHDYAEFTHELEVALDPDRLGDGEIGPFVLHGVIVEVRPPEDFADKEDENVQINALPNRIATALSRGEKALAANLQDSLDFIEKYRPNNPEEIIRRAENLTRLQQSIRDILDRGVPRDHPNVRELERQISEYVKAPVEGIEPPSAVDRTADAAPHDMPDDAPPSEIPDDRD
jgi:hypothetical protein